jgi:arsenate reductase-like glutaredoxin family protein
MDNELKPAMKIALAINKINSNAKFDFNGDDIDTIEINWIDGTNPISKEDIKNMITTVEEEFANRNNKKASGKQKLKDLGLDDDEIKALMGA